LHTTRITQLFSHIVKIMNREPILEAIINQNQNLPDVAYEMPVNHIIQNNTIDSNQAEQK
jgi:hypothetical protein